MNWENMTGLEQCWQDKLPIPRAVHVTITGSQDRSLLLPSVCSVKRRTDASRMLNMFSLLYKLH